MALSRKHHSLPDYLSKGTFTSQRGFYALDYLSKYSFNGTFKNHLTFSKLPKNTLKKGLDF